MAKYGEKQPDQDKVAGIEGPVNFESVSDFVDSLKGKELEGNDADFLKQAEEALSALKLAESTAGETANIQIILDSHKKNLVRIYEQHYAPEGGAESAEVGPEQVAEVAEEYKEKIDEGVTDLEEYPAGQARQDAVEEAKAAAAESKAEIDEVVEDRDIENMDFEGAKDFVEKVKGEADKIPWKKEFVSKADDILKAISTVEAMLGENTSAPATIEFHKNRLLELCKKYYGEEAEKECPNCGQPRTPGGGFCGSCGTNIRTGETPEEAKAREKREEAGEENPEEDGEQLEGMELLEKTLETMRKDYTEALRDRRKAFNFRSRKFGVGKVKEKAEAKYQDLVSKYEAAKKAYLAEKMKQVSAEMAAEAREGGDINEALFDKLLDLLNQEEEALDGISTSSERSSLKKFQQWWKKHSKARLAAGVVMGAAGTAMTFTGVGAAVGAGLFGSAFAIARGGMSGMGTYMTAEQMMDTRTKSLGQKGLIDDASAIGKKAGLNIFERGQKNKEKIQSLVEQAQTSEGIQKEIEALKTSDPDYKDKKEYLTERLGIVQQREASGVEATNAFDSYDIDELRAEIVRLRTQGLDKGTSITEAGRFGKSQEDLVKLLKQAYYKQMKEYAADIKGNFEEEGSDNPDFDAMMRVVGVETQVTESTMLSEADKQRSKAMKRHGLAAGLGLTVGLVDGSRWADKLADGERPTGDEIEMTAEGAETPETPEPASVEPEVTASPDAVTGTEDAAEAVVDRDPDTGLPRDRSTWRDIQNLFKEDEAPSQDDMGTGFPKPPGAETPPTAAEAGDAAAGAVDAAVDIASATAGALDTDAIADTIAGNLVEEIANYAVDSDNLEKVPGFNYLINEKYVNAGKLNKIKELEQIYTDAELKASRDLETVLEDMKGLSPGDPGWDKKQESLQILQDLYGKTQNDIYKFKIAVSEGNLGKVNVLTFSGETFEYDFDNPPAVEPETPAEPVVEEPAVEPETPAEPEASEPVETTTTGSSFGELRRVKS